MSVLVLGTDFSARSDRALRRAVLLAREAGHELLIVAVLEDDPAPVQPQRQDPSVLLRRMQQTITDHDGVRCSVELREGRPGEQLAEAARHAGAALMVIGPHRRSLVRDAFGAITAERIAQQSPVPLICANGVPCGPYRRLLVPVDVESGPPGVVPAVRALGIARAPEIVLLHVYDAEAREMLGRAFVTGEERRRYLSECAAAAQDKLRDFARSADAEGATLLVEESSGLLSDDIGRIALEETADLVVLSRSQKGLVAKTILGSVTEDLLRSGRLDVLVMPDAR